MERWFSKIERNVIARGVLMSKRDLSRKIRRYIDRDDNDARPFRRASAEPRKRIVQHGYK